MTYLRVLKSMVPKMQKVRKY